MLWLFGEGVLSARGRFRQGLSILPESLKLVMKEVSEFIFLLIVFEGRDNRCCWLSVILLTGPR